MLTKEEYMALADQKYEQLHDLKNKTTLLDHEQAFETIWMDLGKQVLQKTISQPKLDRRKKKR
jgi:hypothetical protein